MEFHKMRVSLSLTALTALSILLIPPSHASANPLMIGAEPAEQIVIHNRILANVDGKAISVIDLTKKMDILFYREFPQYATAAAARFQFYQANWKYVLHELIEKELILADAKENKLPVSSGEVRQEMETLFGPNIIANLDKIGMTFDDAYQIIQGDLILQRMLYIRIHAKALRDVTPLEVTKFYEEYSQANATIDEWVYQTISIRNKSGADAAETANAAYDLLVKGNLPLADLQMRLKDAIPAAKESQITISEENKHDEKSISQGHKEILKQMAPGTYSQPIAQQSRNSKETVFRLFFLKEMTPGGLPPFAKVENQLKQQLLAKVSATEAKAYIARLKRHFDVQELVPNEFQPFAMQ